MLTRLLTFCFAERNEQFAIFNTAILQLIGRAMTAEAKLRETKTSVAEIIDKHYGQIQVPIKLWYTSEDETRPFNFEMQPKMLM